MSGCGGEPLQAVGEKLRERLDLIAALWSGKRTSRKMLEEDGGAGESRNSQEEGRFGRRGRVQRGSVQGTIVWSATIVKFE
jgi:hypothetical protein